MTRRTLTVVCLLVSIAFADRGVRCAQSRTSPLAASTPEQRRQVARLLAQFRRARGDPQQRARIVGEALDAGRPVVAALHQAIGRELHPKLERYRDRFGQRAAVALQKRMVQVDFGEVARLRATVLGLRQAADFSKQTIVQKADPALQRLKEILLIDRQRVLDESEALQSEREQLAEIGQSWQQCAEYLAREVPDVQQGNGAPADFSAYLRGEEELAVGLAASMNGPTRQIILVNARLAARLDPEEARAILMLNFTRNLLGLRPLMIDPKLSAAAREHSQDMERLKFFSHVSPVPGKQTMADRARRTGTTAAAENIYRGTPSGKVAHDGWFHSPAHHKNMLGNHTRLGIGRSGVYFTLMFGK